MERRLYWGVGIVSVVMLLWSFFLQRDPVELNELPWHIEHPAPGTTRIFGLTLGQSTTHDAERRFRDQAKSSMFKSPDGQLIVEMFFEQVTMAELKARIVAVITVPASELPGMYERGLRISATASGKKITLTPDDVNLVRSLPINSLTYMPSVRIEEKTIGRLFGQPTLRIKERKGGAVHWLYPQHGLDITLGSEEKPVMQYVSPSEFHRLSVPLQIKGDVLTDVR